MHEAHINIPLQLKDDYNLERIIFVPTGTSPVGKTFKAGNMNIPVNLYAIPDNDGWLYGFSFGYALHK